MTGSWSPSTVRAGPSATSWPCARLYSPIGRQVRVGIHTGEIELRGDAIGGITVHIAARIRENARPGELLTSGAVPLLVAGSSIDFEDRGQGDLA